MSEHHDTLGPVTEARFAKAFETKAVVGVGTARVLLGLDDDTIKSLTEAGVIRSVPKGAKHRGYTEWSLRNYLLEQHESPCANPEPKPRPKTAPQGNLKVVNFSERRRQKA